MSVPSEKQSSSSFSEQEAAPVPAFPARSVPVSLLWFAASLLLALAGAWGGIAGWYFGLPGGGEVRRNLFDDQPLSWRDLFVAIPHPDLAELPFVPKPAGDGFQVREKFRDKISWNERSWTSRSIRKESSNPTDPPSVFTSDVPVYTTNLVFARTVFAAWPKARKQDYCLLVRSSGQKDACVSLHPDMPLDTPTNVPIRLLGERALSSPFDATPLSPAFFDGQSSVSGSAGSSIYLAGFSGLQEDPYSLIVSAASGAEAGGAATTDQPTIWTGGLAGHIFKISVDHTGTSVSMTHLRVPFAAAIEFVAFVSPQHGWVWTPSANDGGAASLVAAQTFDGGANWQLLSYRWLPAPWVFIAFVLGAIAFERGTTAHVRAPRIAAEKYIADYGVSDDPIGLDDEDALGLRPIAKSMARFLRNTETKPTVAIAVTGPWGSGKTSLMNMVKEELNQRDVRTAWFNAWHNQKEENLLAALLAAIRTQAVPPLWTVSGFIYRLRVAWMRVGADPNATIAVLVFAIAAFGVVATHLDATANYLSHLADRIGALLSGLVANNAAAPAAASEAIPGAASAITSIGLSTGGITALVFAGKKLWDLFKPLKSIPAELLSTLSGQSSTKDIDQQLSFRYRFAAEFAIFCDTLRQPPHPGLVIFIDDLDRCAPKQTVDILEAINFVTSAGRCFVVLGLDESKVKAAIADSYKDMTLRLDSGDPSKLALQTPAELQQQKLADLNEFASHYLEKLIHLVVPVPRSREDSVELLLGLKPSSGKREETPRWRRSVKTASQMLGTVLVVGLLMSSAWLGLVLLTKVLPAATSAAATGTAPIAPAAGPQPALPPPAATPAGGNATLAPTPAVPLLSAADLAGAGLTSPGVLGIIPPIAVVLAFALLLAIVSFQFLPRLQTEPIVSDGPQFQEALKIWLAGITKTRETPRAVKRFVNRLRFMAMRLRDLSTEATEGGRRPPLDEAALVAMAVIEDLDENCLGKTDEELRKRQLADEGRKADVRIILSSLREFRREFGRDPYADAVALPTFRLLAGLVAEGRDQTTSEASSPKA